MKLKTAVIAALMGFVSAASTFANWTYVGSWDLATVGGGYGDPSNPYIWSNNPAVFSGVEAAALLFGGTAADYAISTISSNVADINHLTFLDGWGDSQYLYNPQSETYKLDSGAPGYNTPYGGPAYSALVVDHAPFEASSFVNYAFRWNGNGGGASVPDRGWTLGFVTFALLGVAAIRRRIQGTEA